MNRRHTLGQHFLVSESIAKAIVDNTNITKKDTVLEIGTGKGILVSHLCKLANHVTSIETDRELYLQALEKFSNLKNLSLKHGDGFKLDSDFTIFISNLPYSKSRDAIEWLVQKNFSHAVIMVQKEFAEKLLAKLGDKNYRAISVLANYCFRITHVMDVKKTSFSPPPKVDSVVLRLDWKHKLPKNMISAVNKLFSYRRKTIHNVAKQFGISIDSNQRLDDMAYGEIIKLAKQTIKI